MKSKRSKACDISKNVKKIVWERDGGKCVVCGCNRAFPNAHYISRAQGGLGIPENIVTLCLRCHFEYDNGKESGKYKNAILGHLRVCYPHFNENELYYRKGMS